MSLPSRLTKIDVTLYGDVHPRLREGDNVFHFGEYFSGEGFEGGPMNQLISNLKIKPSVAAQNSKRKYYKDQAIATVARGLRGGVGQTAIETATWVPVPTSKMPGHAEYDDRLIRALTNGFRGFNADVRQILRKTANHAADHESDDRLTPQELYELLEVDQAVLAQAPLRSAVVLFDDVLTTGKTFKCCERRLREVIPANVPIFGMVVGRRIYRDAPDSEPPEDWP